MAECSLGKREALGSSPSRAMIFSSHVIFDGQCGFAARATSIKKCIFCYSSFVPSRFVTDLIKQGENVKGRPSGSIAQMAECSHGKREALGSSPSRAMIFSSPVTFTIYPVYMHLEGTTDKGETTTCTMNMSKAEFSLNGLQSYTL